MRSCAPLCTACGRRRPVPGRYHCRQCIAQARQVALAKAKLRRQEAISLGRCVTCHKRPAQPGRRQCRRCTLRTRRQMRNWLERRGLT